MAPDAHEPHSREGIDIPFGPPPEEYLYRCGVCGEEMLVNEAIIDVAVGAASFVVRIGAACLRLTAKNVMGRPWNTSSKSPSPPRGRYVCVHNGVRSAWCKSMPEEATAP